MPQFNCIAFDITTREIILTAPLFDPASDFLIISNPSVQNAGVLVSAKCFNLQFPLYGVGIGGAINGPASGLNYGLNQWKTQCANDGATYQNFKIDNATQRFTCFINYLANGIQPQTFGGG